MLSLGQPPKKLTVPPRRTMLTAHCQVCGLPTASMATSTPRPWVIARIDFTGSLCSPANDQFVGAQCGRAIQLRLPAADRDHAAAVELGQFDEHQSDRTQADNRHRVAGARSRFLQAAHHARQRFDQRRVLIAHFVGNQVGIALHDAGRNANVLGVGAVVEQQVLAEILEAPVAEETLPQGAEFAATTR